MKPQTAAVLELLRDVGPGGLTPLAALGAPSVGSLRLAGRIHELRAEGFDIETIHETRPTGKRFARYVLHERPVQMDLFRDPPVSGRREVTPRVTSTAHEVVAPITLPARAG